MVATDPIEASPARRVTLGGARTRGCIALSRRGQGSICWQGLPAELTNRYHDVAPALADQARQNSRGQSDTPGRARWPLDAWPAVPTRFVLCTEDRFFPPWFMRRVVVERLGIVPDEIAAGHAVALSRPKELADLLVRYSVTAR